MMILYFWYGKECCFINKLPARLKKKTVEHKLKVLKRGINHIIEKLTDLKNFVFSQPTFTLWNNLVANPQIAHLVFADTQFHPKKPKELFLQTH